MPEGPSIVILKELVQPFKGQTILDVLGNTKVGKERLIGCTIIDFKSWGKHFLIQLEHFSVRIHFLLFGSYRINERKEATPRLALIFDNGEINFYTCGVQLIEEDLDKVYDWTSDPMNSLWNPQSAIEKLTQQPQILACDALLDQTIFSGSGNIIKNEVLFRTFIHPESIIGNLPTDKVEELVREVKNYCFDFYHWKKAYELKKHWLAHTKRICPRCNIFFVKKHLGKTNRRSFYCESCQVKH